MEEFFEGPLALKSLKSNGNLKSTTNIHYLGKMAGSTQDLNGSSTEESIIRTEFLKPLFSTSVTQSQRTFRKINLYEESSTILPHKNRDRKKSTLLADLKSKPSAAILKQIGKGWEVRRELGLSSLFYDII